MKTLDSLTKRPDAKIAGIDVSSKKIALAIVSRNGDNWFLHYAFKVMLPDEMKDKIKVMNIVLPRLFEAQVVDHVVIEQSIYIQNPKTSRILSYIIGAIYSICIREGIEISDCLPMQWKNFIGYNKITKEQKAHYISTMGKTKANKFMNKERKDRTKRILAQRIDGVEGINDDDIVDAIGVAMWGLQNVG
jgi:Holliday junction resolvasome RuvABC endonuclease subunit